MAESRKSPRSAAKRPGVATLNDRSELSCTVRDLSATGARVSFAHPIFLPKSVRLRFDEDDQRVTVVWQRGVMAGVKFQTPIKIAAAKKKSFWSLRR
jgi:hypothetical protein